VCFPGDRERVRWMATQLALEMLRRHLLGSGGEAGEAGGDAREAVGEVAGGGERAAPGTGG
jgi:hypothetical protein